MLLCRRLFSARLGILALSVSPLLSAPCLGLEGRLPCGGASILSVVSYYCFFPFFLSTSRAFDLTSVSDRHSEVHCVPSFSPCSAWLVQYQLSAPRGETGATA
ncbi:hypothetical protein V8E53_003230 [Lactarius tabidus]